MKFTNFKCFLLIIICIPISARRINAQENVAISNHSQCSKTLTKLIPHYCKVQFAGSMGALSLGIGWSYGRNRWETDFLLGLVPGNGDRDPMATFTLKQNYMPWKINIGENFIFEPLACGLYLNTLLDDDYWVSNPDKYPKGYYTFSTKIRVNIFAGERLTFKLKENKNYLKSITLFYELSSNDLYLINAINNSTLKPKDYLGLSFGAKFQFKSH